MLPLVDAQLAALAPHAADPAAYGRGGADEYWDDRALALFLRGVCLRYVAHPDRDAVLAPEEQAAVEEGRAEAARGARDAFEKVFEDGPKVVYDHYLVYCARKWARVARSGWATDRRGVDYEYARLLACQGDKDGARRHLELLVSGE